MKIDQMRVRRVLLATRVIDRYSIETKSHTRRGSGRRIFDLKGRLALVTAAGIARHLAEQGARVLVNDLTTDRAEATVASVTADGGQAEALACDVTDRDAAVEHLASRSLDIVVNNAGNAGARMMQAAPFREIDPAQWAPPIDVNLYGVMNMTHAVLPGMCERGFGRLITISSGAGVVGLPIGMAPDGTGKAGAISLMRHMAIENASLGVTANSLALGLMEMT
jgi:3-oxoacyl-[acyl-carrier protein] reductase